MRLSPVEKKQKVAASAIFDSSLHWRACCKTLAVHPERQIALSGHSVRPPSASKLLRSHKLFSGCFICCTTAAFCFCQFWLHCVSVACSQQYGLVGVEQQKIRTLAAMRQEWTTFKELVLIGFEWKIVLKQAIRHLLNFSKNVFSKKRKLLFALNFKQSS